ncbi:MAG: hypothetical protein HYZ49_09525 [Chloroflexi bacterium]|nr:hypothetical protein [Chloroflexota bacterium]
MDDSLVDTWNIHCRINLYLLEAIPSEALEDTAGGKGRSVGAMFTHVHNTRLMWLELTPDLSKGLTKIPKEKTGDKKLLKKSLEASGQAMAKLIEAGAQAGKIKGFKPHPTAFVGYAIAHESYHHGEIGVALSQSGHPLDKKVAYGMWEWGVR